MSLGLVTKGVEGSGHSLATHGVLTSYGGYVLPEPYFPRPPVGPVFAGATAYLTVPRLVGTGTIAPSKVVTFYIETFIGRNRAYGDRVDLINGTRAYRIPAFLLRFFEWDVAGYYVWTPKGKYYFKEQDPTVSIFKINEWTPIGL